ncbi:hypothetical protein Bbelb_032140 [Branchiostoma belcheri]|nr:hypothetical protein Bbelb_032140 [Branchiostoma belcheri]
MDGSAGHPDQGAGNRKYPYQEAGNRAEARGGRNIIIQTGDNANISLAAPFTGRGAANEGYGAAASAMPTPGYTSLPDLPRMQPPRHMPRAFSQDGIQHSQEEILENCIRQLKEMGFTDQGTYKQEVENLFSTGLRTPQDIVQTIVERKTQEHEKTSGQWSSPHTVHSSKDGIIVSNNEGPVQIGKGNIIRGDLDPRSLDKAVQIGEKDSILPHWAENQNLGRKHDRRSTNQQQPFPTQPQQDRFVDDSTAGEITSSARNRRLVEQLPQDRAAGQMAREVPPSDGQDWSPIPEDVSSSSEESEDSASNSGESSSTFDSLDGTTTGEVHQEPRGLTTPPLQNPTGGSPDASLSDESLRLQSGGNMQDNLASNQPESPDVQPDDVSTSDEETLPKAPLEDASANEAATAEPASDQLHPAETREQVEEGADGAGDQPVYDTEQRLYIFSRAHIEKMTENFSPSKKIADGAFGPVYFLERFPYDVDGPSQDRPLKDRPLAIKVNRSEDQGPREFKQELVMAGYRHPHILPLIGICEDEGCLALIYAYMDNKDLLTHMKDQAQRPLNYKQRLLISLDLISAVLYYHRTERFHRDIKSANVLLDGNYRARLGDPGLMIELPMLLELLTGKPADAVDEEGIVLFNNWCDELEYFRDNTGKGLCNVADVCWPEAGEDGNSVTQRFAKLIVGCLQPHPRRRIKLEVLYQELKDLAKTAGVLGTSSAVMPTMCTYCLACKPCPIPMACGCDYLICIGCMKEHGKALYCPNHHADTTGLGQNTFAVIVGQRGFEKDAEDFRDAITNPNICAVR